MRQITKTVQRIGNGAHIYLPRELAGKKVVVSLAEKSAEEIRHEVMAILSAQLEHIEGAYLYGSYARGEQTPESDIDIFVVTDKKTRITGCRGYEIAAGTEQQIEKTLSHNAVMILPILREAKPILNQKLLEKYRKARLTKSNTRWYIETTESSLRLAKDRINAKGRKIPNIVYPLVMRLRGLLLIESIIKNRQFTNATLLNALSRMAKPEQIYQVYREYRDGLRISEHKLDSEDIGALYAIVHKSYQKVRAEWEKLS